MSFSALFFLLAYACGVLGAIFLDGALGIYLYQFEYFANPPRRWWGSQIPSIRYSLVVGLAVLFGYIVRAKKYSDNRLFDAPPLKWWISLVLLSLVLWPLAVSPSAHKFFLDYYIKVMVIGLLMYKLIDTPKKFERLLWVFLLSEFYLGWVVYQTGRNDNGRVEGIGPSDSPDSNGIGFVVVASVPIAAFYILHGKLWQRGVALVAAVFILNAAILINSRGAFLGMLVGGLYVMAYLFGALALSFKKKMQIIAGVLVILAAFIYLTDSAFWERMGTLTNVQVEGATVTGNDGTKRIEYWKAGIRMSMDYPLGTGFNGFLRLTSLYVENYTGTKALHNTYIQALADLGFLGLLLFLALIVSVFRMAKVCRKHVANDPYKYSQVVCITGSFVTILTTSVFLDRLTSELLYWVIVFLSCFYNIYVLKEVRAAALQSEPPRKLSGLAASVSQNAHPPGTAYRRR